MWSASLHAPLPSPSVVMGGGSLLSSLVVAVVPSFFLLLFLFFVFDFFFLFFFDRRCFLFLRARRFRFRFRFRFDTSRLLFFFFRDVFRVALFARVAAFLFDAAFSALAFGVFIFAVLPNFAFFTVVRTSTPPSGPQAGAGTTHSRASRTTRIQRRMTAANLLPNLMNDVRVEK
jgi:hypothetical protein